MNYLTHLPSLGVTLLELDTRMKKLFSFLHFFSQIGEEEVKKIPVFSWFAEEIRIRHERRPQNL
jgi:hypothetical protein